MKTIIVLCVFAFSLAGFTAFAEEGHSEKTGPCKKIMAACEAAGFVKGGHKKDNKGLFVDCMQPTMAGKAVAGVTVDPKDVAACKERKEKHHERHEKKEKHEKHED